MTHAILVLALLFSLADDVTPSFGLSDENCTTEVLMSDVDGAQIFASCASEGKERMMHISDYAAGERTPDDCGYTSR